MKNYYLLNKNLFMEKALLRLIRSHMIHCNHNTDGLPISTLFLPKSIPNTVITIIIIIINQCTYITNVSVSLRKP